MKKKVKFTSEIKYNLEQRHQTLIKDATLQDRGGALDYNENYENF